MRPTSHALIRLQRLYRFVLRKMRLADLGARFRTTAPPPAGPRWRSLDPLEPRILFSASPLGGEPSEDPYAAQPEAAVELTRAGEIGDPDRLAIEALDALANGSFGAGTIDQDARRELIIVDAQTPDHEALVGGLLTERGDGARLEVVVLDSERDGVEQISALLASYTGLDAVHIISHGTDGAVQLGSTWLSQGDLDELAPQITGWSDALSADADLLFYGCNLAASDEGQALVDALAGLSGADVAASTDLTGAERLGGDWDLEYHAGTIESSVAFSADALTKWFGTLEGEVPAAAQAEFLASSLAFEENTGQTDESVDFLARGGGYSVFLTGGDAVIALGDAEGGHAVRLDLLGANADPTATAGDPLARSTNYLIGNDADAWQTDVSSSGSVWYDDVWDGVDVRYYGNQQQLEYDFIVAAGGDADQIRLKFDGTESVHIAENGELVMTLNADGAEVRFKAPYSYQETAGGERETVASAYVIHEDGSVGFTLGAYDASRELVIDPILDYGTFFGGSGTSDSVRDMVVDADGNIYMAGQAGSTNFPTTVGAYDETFNNMTEAFVVKLNPSGDSFAYATYYGGDGVDLGLGLAVDADGNAYLTGQTTSSDLPTLNAFQGSLGGPQDAFLVKLNATGTGILYSTYYGGGSAAEIANDVVVDASGHAYVVGVAYANDLPTQNPLDGTLGGSNDAFLAQFDTNGSGASSLVYATYIGGSGSESAQTALLDGSGHVVITGNTTSADLTTVNAYDSTLGGTQDAFVVEINPVGGGASDLVYSSYYGGSGTEYGYSLAQDPSGYVYITGSTLSADLPTTAGAYDETLGGSSDVYVAKLDLTVSGSGGLVYSTYIGGSAADTGFDLVVDGAGTVYLTGTSQSTDLPVTGDANDSTLDTGSGKDAIFGILDSTGSSLEYMTYLGGQGYDFGRAIDLDSDGNVYIAGEEDQSFQNMGTKNTIGTLGGRDGFVVKFLISQSPVVTLPGGTLAYTGNDPATVVDATATVTDADSADLDGGTLTVDLSFGGTVNDRLAIRDQGAGAGNITISGTDVLYDFGAGGVIIGTFTGGTSGSDPLVIVFNANATAAAAQALARNITYENILAAPPTSLRTLDIVLTDGDGGTSAPATVNIDIAGVNEVTLNSTSSAATAGAATSLTWSHTVTLGNNRALMVGIALESGESTGVTYGGTALTLVGRYTGAHTVEIWQLLAPDVGTHDIVANFSGSIEVLGGGTAFNNVDQTTPTGTFQGEGLTDSSTASVAVSSAPGEVVLDVMFADVNLTATAGAGQSGHWHETNGRTGAGSTEAGAASVTMSWDLSTSEEWTIGAISIKPVAVPNVAPVVNDQAFAVDENTANGTSVGTVAASDANVGDTLSYAITGGTGATAFAINASTGEITVADSAQLDYESTTSFTLTVEVTDDGTPSLSDTATITINLNDLSATVFTVTNTADSGAGSLRQAILDANASANTEGIERIEFNIGGGGPQTIAVGAAGLPVITDSVILDATTQPGYGGTPLITLDGSATPASSGINGIAIRANDSTVKGFIVINFADEGIEMDGSTGFGDNNVIQNNWVGIDAAGNPAGNAEHGIMISADAHGNQIGGTGPNEGNVVGNNGFSGIIINENSDNNVVEGNIIGLKADGATQAANGDHGVLIRLASDGNRIGGTAAGAGNVISGNTLSGVYIDGTTNGTHTTAVTGTLVEGNLIGTDDTGALDRGNGQHGVQIISGATSNTIGGITTAHRNVISANNDGVRIEDSGSNNNAVLGNYIGTDVSGTVDLGNTSDGVVIRSSATGNTVGGTTAGEGNLIVGNGGHGVHIHSPGSVGNAILGNSIHGNDGLGIDLTNDGITTNDAGDSDSGANDLQNFPVLTTAVTDGAGTITIDGSINGAASTTYRIEFFASVAQDASGYGQGETYLGFVDVTTDGSGDATFSAPIAATVPAGRFISATATNPGNSTSEFAQNIVAVEANAAPVVNDQNFNVDENAANGASAGTVAASDANVGDTLSYAITGGTGQTAFSINASTGEITVADSAQLDYETTTSFTLTVEVTDDGSPNLSDTATITINLNDLAATVFTVTTTADSGVGSLRQAILDSNSSPNLEGTDRIVFSIGSGVQTISLTSALPVISEAVIIDGATQPGYAGVPLVVLDGSGAGGGVDGLTITAGDSTIRGLVINRFGGSGIRIDTNGDNVIEGNYIGTDAAGTADLGNQSFGIEISNTGGNTIGGSTAATRNVISGNDSYGVSIWGASASSNVIQGNYIGTSAAGTAALGNGDDGIHIGGGAAGTTIGGAGAGEGNVISANGEDGIELLSTGTDNTTIEGNFVGTDVTGMVALGNVRHGIVLYDEVSGTQIGGSAAGAGNVISANGVNGVVIDGNGSAATANNVLEGNLIGLDAAGTGILGNIENGIRIFGSAANNVIGSAGAGNVISGNGIDGILVDGASGTTIRANFIGTDETGTVDLGNLDEGIELKSGATGNVVGGTAAGDRNVVSGNGGDGIALRYAPTANNTVQGNFIGTDVSGTVALGNSGNGVRLDDAANNTIGGTVAGAANVIADSGVSGVYLTKAAATGNLVQGNFIGTDLGATIDLGNAADGVHFYDGAANNTIGGTAAGAGNVIVHNGDHGLGLTPSTGAGNAILGNSIHGNGSLGIDLDEDGVTANDANDGDSGANDLQNFPVLTSAITDGAGTITISGSINAAASTTYRIELFASTAPDASGYGQGETYLGFVNVTTDGSGDATFSTPLAATVPPGRIISATATNPGNSTSEFSLNVVATPVNTAPTINDQVFAIDENAANGTTVGTVAASDPNGGDTLAYAITGGTGQTAFTINASTGEITVADAGQLDYESTTSFTLTVEVTDDGTPNLSDTATITVNLNDLNDVTPTVTPGQSFGLGENAANGATVGTVLATDPDTVGAIGSWTIVSGNGDGIFQIDANTGEITIADNTNLDYESATSYVLGVRAGDGTNTSATENVTINITDVNDVTPTVTPGQSFGIGEGASNGATVGTVLATDPDTVGSIGSWTIVSGNGDGIFQIDANTGEITIADNTNLDYESATSYVLGVQAGDGTNTSATENVTINVTDVNDVTPTVTPGQSFGIGENAANGATVGTVLATDPDTVGSLGSWTIVSGNADGIFQIDANTGEITIADNTNLDYESATSYVLGVRAGDGTNTSATENVTINVTDINDVTPTVTPGQSFGIGENAANGATVGTVLATDPDTVGSLGSWTIVSGNADGIFQIDANTGEITIADNTNLDYESATSHVLGVRAGDGTNTSATENVTINVTDVNDVTPTVTPGQSFGIGEDAANGTSAGTVLATDPDTVGSLGSWTIVSGNGDGIFQIDANTGEITIADNTNLDYESATSYVLGVQAGDGTNTSATETVTINVTDVNDVTPTVTPGQSFGIGEDAANGATVGTVLATDPDTVGSIGSWTIVSGNGDGIFQIDANTGEITIADNTNLDYESATSYVIGVQAGDGTNTSATENVTINVSDANDVTPTVTPGQSFGIGENAANGATVGTVLATDPDTVGSIGSWTIVSGNGDGIFQIDANTGEVTIADSTNLDYESATSYVLGVRAGDGTNTSATENVTINVTDVNDVTPTVTPGQSFGIGENAANGATVGTVLATDPDTVGSLGNWAIVSGNGDGIFQIDANTGEITIADNANLDYESVTSYVLGVQVGDGTNTAVVEGVTINVTDVNDVTPTVTPGQSFGIGENAANGASVGTALATDPDTVGAIGSWAIVSGNGDGIFQIDANTGEITIADNTDLDYESATSYVLGVQAGDGTNTSATENVTINVTDVNDVTPTVTPGQSFGIGENAANGATVGTVLATDPDTVGSLGSWTIVSGNGDGIFQIDANTGEITIADNTNLDYESATSYVLGVQAGDGTNTSATENVTINVSDANDVTPTVTPGQSFGIGENAANGATVGTVLATDTDTVGSIGSWTIVSGNGDGIFQIDANTGEITIADNTNLDYESATSYVLGVQAGDGTNTSATENVTINVTDVNDVTPTVTPGQSFGIGENAANGATVGTVLATDPDTVGSLGSWAIVSGNGDGIFQIDANTGEITIADNTNLDYESATSYVLGVQAGDGTNTSATENVTINVTDVNDVTPTVTPGQSFGIGEDAANGATVGSVLATDPDTVGSLGSWTIVSGNGDGIFQIDANTGEITIADNTNLDYESATSYVLGVQAGDGTNTSAAESVTINVTDVNDVTPTVTPGQSFGIGENAANGATVGTVLATDPDTVGSLGSWTIVSGNADGIFQIDANTGEITIADNTNLDYESATSYVLGIQAGDGTNTSATENVTINVTDVNDVTPTVTPGQSFGVAEDAANGASLGTVLATDPDTVGSLGNWTIVSGNADGIFQIDANTGEITIADNTNLDYESVTSYVLGVRAGDGTNTSAAENITINVTNTGEAPTTTGIADITVDEDSSTISIDLHGAFDDAEDDDASLDYAVVANTNAGLLDSAAFEDVSGTLKLDLASNVSGSATMSVRATDSDGQSVTATFFLMVRAVNDAPVVAAQGDIAVDEGQGAAITADDLRVTDVDDAAEAITFTLKGLPSTGALSVGGTILLDGDSFTQADIDAGRLTYHHGGGTTSRDSFRLTITDGSGAQANVTIGVSVTARPVLRIAAPPESSPGPDRTPKTETAAPERDGDAETTPDEVSEESEEAENEPDAGEDSVDAAGDAQTVVQSDAAATKVALHIGAESPATAASWTPSDGASSDAAERSDAAARPAWSAAPLAFAAPPLETLQALQRQVQESFRTDLIFGQMSSMGRELSDALSPQKSTVKVAFGTAASTTSALAIGYAVWALRGGSFLASALTLLPSLPVLDPLPVLEESSRRSSKGRRQEDEDDRTDRRVGQLFT